MLAFLADGIELLAAPPPVIPFFSAAPLPAVVPPFIESPVVILLAAGPPASELPPAVLPVCEGDRARQRKRCGQGNCLNLHGCFLR